MKSPVSLNKKMLCDQVAMTLRHLQKKWITRVSAILIFLCNVPQLHTPWSHKESISLFIFISYKLIISFNMSKIYLIIDIIGHFITPRAIDESKEVLTFNLCQFNRVYIRKLTSFLCPLHKILAKQVPYIWCDILIDTH